MRLPAECKIESYMRIDYEHDYREKIVRNIGSRKYRYLAIPQFHLVLVTNNGYRIFMQDYAKSRLSFVYRSLY